jgi:WD40 repeat protein
MSVWDVRTGKHRRTLGEGGDAIQAVAVSPDGGQLAWGDSTGRVRLWDLTTAKEVGSRVGQPDGHFYSITFSPDGKTLAAACSGGNALLWSVRGFVGR